MSSRLRNIISIINIFIVIVSFFNLFFTKKSNHELDPEQSVMVKKIAKEEFNYYKNLDGIEVDESFISTKQSGWNVGLSFTYKKDQIDFPQLILSRGFKYWKTISSTEYFCKEGLLLSFSQSDISLSDNRVYGGIEMDKSYDCLSVK